MTTVPVRFRSSAPQIFYINNVFREVAQLGRALGLGPRGRRFESCLPDHSYLQYGVLAQLGERLLCTQEVRGSIPLDSTYSEEYPSLAEGIGLENRQAGNTARGFESLFLLHIL